MKRLLMISIPILLVLSFLLIVMISPDKDTWISRFKEDQYIEVATFDSPGQYPVSFSLGQSLPFYVKIEKNNSDQVQVIINRSLSQRQIDYIKDGLIMNYRESVKHQIAYLEINMTENLFYFRGEGFNLVYLFDDYKYLSYWSLCPLFLIKVPEDYSYQGS